MKICNSCTSRSIWECKCSQFFCKSHIWSHLNQFQDHKDKHSKILSPVVKLNLRSVIKRRLKAISQANTQISRDTAAIISKVLEMHNKTIENLQSLKSKYMSFVEKEDFSKEEFDEVDELRDKII